MHYSFINSNNYTLNAYQAMNDTCLLNILIFDLIKSKKINTKMCNRDFCCKSSRVIEQ